MELIVLHDCAVKSEASAITQTLKDKWTTCTHSNKS